MSLILRLFLLIGLLLTAGAIHAQSGSCRVATSACIDTADRVINGITVSRPCWEYRDTYECVDPGAVNYCVGLQAQPSCSMQNVVCNETAFNGACKLETKTYACSGTYTGPPVGVIDLGSTYTITSATQDLGTCTSPASNPACTQTAPQVCVDGPGYKTIDGVSVYQDCWEWSRNYACSVSAAVNYCQPLAGAGCVESSAACIETGSDGACNSTRRNYVCTDKPPVAGSNIVLLDTSYTITKDAQNTTACDANAANPTCAVASTVCIEGPETRVINGLPVYKACWKTQVNYSCSLINAADYCAPLAGAGCTRQGTGVCAETGADGQCNRYNETYTCANNGSVTGPNIVATGTNYTVTKDVVDTTACDANSANPRCAVSGTVCAEGPETRVINGLPVYKDCWRSLVTYTCSQDNAVNFCAPLVAAGCTQQGAKTCTLTGPDGQCNRYEETYSCLNNGGVTGSNVTKLDTAYTIKTDQIDDSACAAQQGNNACAKPPTQVCTQGPETRTINGLAVYKDCWQWQQTYSCQISDAADYCSPLKVLGCTEAASVCDATGPDGVCNSYTKSYTCLNNTGVSGQNVVNLSTNYTIRNDFLETASCADPASNPACTVASETCVEPGGTRNINGLDVYKACWKYDRTYTCTVSSGANYCSPVAATPGCKSTGSTCIETGTDGRCIASEATYRCDDALANPLPTNVAFLNNAYTIVKDTIKDQCSDPASNSSCRVLSETCAEPGGTRNINGLDVYKPCWRWDRSYICQDASQVVSECAEFEGNPKCTLSRQTCAIDQFTGVPDCGLTTKIFSCEVRPAGSTDVQTCFEQSCVGSVCGKEEDAADPDFAKTVAVLELQRQAAGYMDESGRIFQGFKSRCERRLFGLSNCCKEKVQASNSSNATVFATQGLKFASEVVLNVGSAYVWDGYFGTAVNLYPEITGFVGGQVSKSYVAQPAAANSFSAYGIKATVQTFPNAATFAESFSVNWSFDPYSFALAIGVQILTKLAACNQEEQSLALKKGQRLCTLVGSYKTGSIFRRSFEGYCCYNSRLGRIVQEQGRKQLGKSYGSPRNPDCTGLTPEELEQLDFSKMDLSEFVADVQSKALDTTAALNRFVTRGESITASTATNKNEAIAQYMPPTPGGAGAVDRTPGQPGSPAAQTPRSNDDLRGCTPPRVMDEQVGVCKDPSGYYYEPYTNQQMPCARGFVRDPLAPACVDPATGIYYPFNSTVPMPCPAGRYLKLPEGVCKEPTAPE